MQNCYLHRENRTSREICSVYIPQWQLLMIHFKSSETNKSLLVITFNTIYNNL